MGSRGSNGMDCLASLDKVRTPPTGKSAASRKKMKKRKSAGNAINEPGSSLQQRTADSALNRSGSNKKIRKVNNHFRKKSYAKRGHANDFLGQAQQKQGFDGAVAPRSQRKDIANTKSKRAQTRENCKKSSVCEIDLDDSSYDFIGTGTPDGFPSDEDEGKVLSQDENDSRAHARDPFFLDSDSDSDAEPWPSKPSSASKHMGDADTQMITQNLCSKPKLKLKKINGKSKLIRRPKPPTSGGVKPDDDILSVSSSSGSQFERPNNIPERKGRRGKLASNDYERRSDDEHVNSSTKKRRGKLASNDYERRSDDEHENSSTKKKSPGISPGNFYEKAKETIGAAANSIGNAFGSAISSAASTPSPKKTKKSQSRRRHPSARVLRSKRSKSIQKNSVIVLSSDEESDEEFVDDINLNHHDDDFQTEIGIAKALSMSQDQTERRRSARVEKKQMGGRETVEATRIAIGNKVFVDSCKLSYQPGTQRPFLRLECRRLPSSEELTTHNIFFDEDDIVEVQYFITEDESEIESGSCGEDEIPRTVSCKSNAEASNNVERNREIQSNVDDNSKVDQFACEKELKDDKKDVVDLDAEGADGMKSCNDNNDAQIRNHDIKDAVDLDAGEAQILNDEDEPKMETSDSTVKAGANTIVRDRKKKKASTYEEMNYLIMRIKPSEKNGLSAYSNAYLADNKRNTRKIALKKRFVVLEVRDRLAFESLITKFRDDATLGPLFNTVQKLGAHEKDRFIQSLLVQNSEKRTRSMVSRRPQFKEDETILVYPFRATVAELDSAAVGLIETAGRLPVEIDSVNSDATDAPTSDETVVDGGVANKTHMVTIRGEDFDRLVPCEFLNDTLIDFWMKWITRKMGADEKLIHVFTTQFFSRLEDKGVDAITSWTAKKGIDIFEKKFVFIPVNKDIHWSLLVVVNPGKIQNKVDIESDNEEVEFPFILFMDSLRAHKKKKLKNLVFKWLNSEAKRLGKFQKLPGSKNGIFNNLNMPVIDPKVPVQDNSWDCGVFVCRYAYGILRLFDQSFACKPSFWRIPANQKKLGEKWIADTPEFNFGMSDIARLRDEIAKLIEELSNIYKKKQEQKKQNRLKKKESSDTKFQHGKGPADIDI